MNIQTNRMLRDAHALALQHREKLPYLVAGFVCLLIYGFSQERDASVHIYKSEGATDFKDARVLGSQGDAFYEGKEKLLSKTVRELMAAQASLRESNEKLSAKVEEFTKGKPPTPGEPIGPTPLPSGDVPTNVTQEASQKALLSKEVIRVSPSSESFSVSEGPLDGNSHNSSRRPGRSRARSNGTSIISFPVKDIAVEKSEGVVLPAGSYVKAKLLTGVEAPEGKTYPVLLQLDYAYIVPNKHKLDLSGCFMIAKSQGDLSTERVQMQATKLSCVSKDGRMFEREVNGFIADDKDNSFAVMGSVNSKQDRVAAMAFLSSIVEGVGKGIQQAQTTQQTTPLGGSQSVLTGNSAEYMAAGGASNAASMVTQWYLKQAQNLLPTINVGSGQDVWIVMQDTVKLPNDYFRKLQKGGASESVYTYFSRVLD